LTPVASIKQHVVCEVKLFRRDGRADIVNLQRCAFDVIEQLYKAVDGSEHLCSGKIPWAALDVQVSPTREQVGGQPAMEAIPLVMEPESRFYHEPVVVLDFQSLYPSIVIAYNLCFSTCLGSPQHCELSTTEPIRLGVYRCAFHLRQISLYLPFTRAKT
jgi:hypothetical protein